MWDILTGRENLERFFFISSTCYVKKDLHSMEIKRDFSKSGRLIIIF